MNCGFIFNFRNKDNRTFFVTIKNFLDYTNQLNKKSININDVLKMNPIEIENNKLRTNYRYNIDELLISISIPLNQMLPNYDQNEKEKPLSN